MWPKQYGGGGLSIDENRVLQQELGAHQRAPGAVELRHLDARARAARVRQRSTEARIPAEDRARRDPLVPGLLGTGFRFRPRRACARAPKTWATTTSSTARRSGRRTPTKPTGSSVSCAPNFDVPKHEGISFLLFDMESPGVSTSADHADQRLVAVLPDVLRQRQSAEAEPRRQRESRLDDRETPAAARTADDRRHRRQLGARRNRPQDGRHREGICRRRRRPHRRRGDPLARSPAIG